MEWLLISRPTDDVEKWLEQLIAALLDVLNLLPCPLDCATMHRWMYKLLLFKHHEILYARLQQMLKDHLCRTVTPSLAIALSKSSPGSSLEGVLDDNLREVSRAVADYKFALDFICDLAKGLVCIYASDWSSALACDLTGDRV